MRNGIGKNILKCFILLIGGSMAGTLLLVLAFLIPVNEDKAQESFDIIVGEPSYPALPVVGDLTGMNLQSFKPGILDNSSDEIMLFTALDTIRTDQNALQRSMSMYNGYMGKEYSYYWHGYVSILRPLLCVISYDDLRFVNGLLQMLLIFVLVIRVWKKKGAVYGAVMFTSYILLMPIAVMFSLQYTWIFYIAMLSVLLLISRSEWFVENRRYIPFFFAVGMLTSYFDLLTYPLFTWGIPLLWWLMMREPAGRGERQMVDVVVSGISWILGYGIFWAMKWCLGTLILKQNIIQAAIDEIFIRSGMEEKLSAADRFGAAYTNWRHYGYIIYMLILLVWLVWGLARGLWKGWTVRYNIYAYCLTGISSVAWYYVLANHTLAHHFFTYRIFNVSILAFLAIWVEAFWSEGSGDSCVRMGRCAKLLGVLLIGIASICSVYIVSREDIWANNGYVSYHRVRLSEQSPVSMTFKPTYTRVKELGICGTAAGESGMLGITVLDGENVIYQEECPLGAWGTETYHSMPVNWKFRSGREYIMQIQLLGDNDTVDLFITEEGVLPMSEYGTPQINGVAVGGQIVSGITYWHYPTSRKMQIYLMFTWMGILTCVALVLYTLYHAVEEKHSANAAG